MDIGADSILRDPRLANGHTHGSQLWDVWDGRSFHLCAGGGLHGSGMSIHSMTPTRFPIIIFNIGEVFHGNLFLFVNSYLKFYSHKVVTMPMMFTDCYFKPRSYNHATTFDIQDVNYKILSIKTTSILSNWDGLKEQVARLVFLNDVLTTHT